MIVRNGLVCVGIIRMLLAGCSVFTTKPQTLVYSLTYVYWVLCERTLIQWASTCRVRAFTEPHHTRANRDARELEEGAAHGDDGTHVCEHTHEHTRARRVAGANGRHARARASPHNCAVNSAKPGRESREIHGK